MAATPTPLVGRARELACLEAALEGAEVGAGAAWLVTGDAGMGKSRLLEAVVERATAQGFEVAWGRSWEAGGAPAFWPWLQVMRAVSRSGRPLSPSAQACLGDVLPELCPLSPQGIAAAPDRPHVDPQQERFQRYGAFCSYLTTSEGRLLVVLEDLHAADVASVELLELLADSVRGVRLLVIATARPLDARRAAASQAFQRLERKLHRLELEALSKDELSELVERELGWSLEADRLERFREVTLGNPLFATELLRLWGRDGPSSLRTGMALPRQVEQVIAERLAWLPAELGAPLEALAVVAHDLSAAELSRAFGLPAPEVERALRVGVELGVLKRAPDSALSFTHVLVREVCYARISPERRRELHRRFAGSLALASVPAWPEVVQHLIASEDQASLIHAATEAGRQAASQRAYPEAARFFELALGTLERHAPDESAACRLLLELGRVHLRSDQLTEGKDLCVDAWQRAERAGHVELMAEAALEYGSVFVYAQLDGQLADMLRGALDALGPADSGLRARLLARYAAAQQPARDPEGPMAMAREAIGVARRVGDAATVLETIRSACSALMDFAKPEERRALNLEQVALARELASPWAMLRAHMRLCMDSLELGELSVLEEHIHAVSDSVEEMNLPQLSWLAPGFRSILALCEGRFAEAERLNSEARAAADASRDPNRLSLSLQRYNLFRSWGRLHEVQDEFPALRASLQSNALLRACARLMEAAFELEQGPVVLSEATFDRILMYRDTSSLGLLTDVLVHTPNASAARRTLECFSPRSGYLTSWGLFGLSTDGPIDLQLGRLAVVAGEPERADQYLRAATDLARRISARPSLAAACFARAQLGFGLSVAERAELAGESVQLLHALDMPIQLAAAEELLRALQAEPQVAERPLPAAPGPASSLALERRGEFWCLSHPQGIIQLRDSKGVQLLAELVSQPGVSMHVLDLSARQGDGPADLGDAGEALDDAARAQYKQRLEDLRDALERAEAMGDAERAGRLSAEFELISAELRAAFGLGGRARRSGSAVERARVNVQRRLKDAIRRISEHDAEVGKRLARDLKTGTFCTYEPL